MSISMNQEHKRRFSQIFQDWMDETGQSQQGISGVLGINQSTVNNWVKQRTVPTWDMMLLVAEKMGKTPEGLVAEIRGAKLAQIPSDLPPQDVIRLCLNMPRKERVKAMHMLIDSLDKELATA